MDIRRIQKEEEMNLYNESDLTIRFMTGMYGLDMTTARQVAKFILENYTPKTKRNNK